MMSSSEKIQQPPWHPPATNRSVLHVLNTLTREKVPFVSLDGNVVRWYSCGPTVYDAAHMGHARNYVTFDILRRVMASYFNYDITYVMNITDIDDKIILRARQAHLVEQFAKENAVLDDGLRGKLLESVRIYAQGKLNVSIDDASQGLAALSSLNMDSDEEGKLSLARDTALKALEALTSGTGEGEKVYAAFQDILAYDLDRNLGHTVDDQAIFRSLASFWERDFLQDMRSLNVLPPDFMTRVSEYVPEIISYVQRIIENGFGYVAEGSVYFDVAAFSTAGHHYARLCPWSAGNSKFFEEGEGALGMRLTGKKDPRDFALWKQSKPGEPRWPSPWGDGRPGWHIECSAMASSVMPGHLDIHSGGVDLAFPHHDNELAQAEAFLDHSEHPWVRYFLHAGHVHIAGLKMSKSLKNFISIKEALKKYSARQLRLMFLQHAWSATMSFKDASMDAAIAAEGALVNFFGNLQALLRDATDERRFAASEQKLLTELQGSQTAVHEALCDSFDTPRAMSVILDLVTRTNVYMQSGKCPATLSLVGRFVAKMVDTFGVQIGDAEKLLRPALPSGGAYDRWSVLGPVLTQVSEYRDVVRTAALKKADDLRAIVLTASDRLRDSLAETGVIFEDRTDQPALVKLVSPEDTARSRQAAREDTTLVRRTAQLSLQADKERRRVEQARISPQQMFRSSPELYSQFDDDGIPTHDTAGQPLSKNARKKAQKEWEAQHELCRKYSQTVAD